MEAHGDGPGRLLYSSSGISYLGTLLRSENSFTRRTGSTSRTYARESRQSCENRLARRSFRPHAAARARTWRVM